MKVFVCYEENHNDLQMESGMNIEKLCVKSKVEDVLEWIKERLAAAENDDYVISEETVGLCEGSLPDEVLLDQINDLGVDITEFHDHQNNWDYCFDIKVEAMELDVEPVRHGHWIEEDDIQICSECGAEHEWSDYRASYCDECGAKMDR